jgi:hypothetical protein
LSDVLEGQVAPIDGGYVSREPANAVPSKDAFEVTPIGTDRGGGSAGVERLRQLLQHHELFRVDADHE